MTLWLNGYALRGDTVDIQYSGDTQITGPAPALALGFRSQSDFDVTVSPCSVQPTCTVVVKARYRGVEKQTSAKVSH